MQSPMSLMFDERGHIVVAARSAQGAVTVAKFDGHGTLLWQRETAREADEERDSVSPVQIHGRPPARKGARIAATSVLAACAFTIGAAGVGIAQPSRLPASAGELGANVTRLAEGARASAPTGPAPLEDRPTHEAGAGPTSEPSAAPDAAATSEPPLPARADAGSSPIASPDEAQRPAAAKTTPAAAAEPARATTAEGTADEPGRTGDLRQRAIDALEEGELEAAMRAGRQLVVSAPSDAFGYRVLGAALQDQGHHDEARATYYACAQHAWYGNLRECMALVGDER